MRLGILREPSRDKRVAITPDVVKKCVHLGYDVWVESKAGEGALLPDESFEKAGAVCIQSREDILKQADVFLGISPFQEEDISLMQDTACIVGLLKPNVNKELIRQFLTKKKGSVFSLDCLPRVTRAQPMDVLSSQSNLGGYQAIMESTSHMQKVFPMMMTAAGTIPAAHVLVLGAGVAGLQAIATAKRLGAIVSAFDVRRAAKEQVESLGAKFIEVPIIQEGEGVGGYAQEMSEAYHHQQNLKLKEVVKTQDCVVTTAQIPWKRAPILLTQDMIEGMKKGALIIDLAGETGGNTELSRHGEKTHHHGVQIICPSNILNAVALDASVLYARNMFNFLNLLFQDPQDKMSIRWDDDIVSSTAIVKHGGAHHPFLEG